MYRSQRDVNPQGLRAVGARQRVQRGDGPGLEKEQTAVGKGPLNVLGRSVQGCHTLPQVYQGSNLRIREGPLPAVCLYRFGAPVHQTLHHGGLGAHRRFQHPAGASVNDMVIRFHHAADQGFAQAERGLDDGFGAPPRKGVGGEQDTRCFALHHLLHDHRQGDRGLIHAVAGPIADGACRPEAAEAVDNGGEQIVLAQHVQERVLLAGKGQVRQVLGGGGGAHRHPRSAQVAVGGTDLGCQ